MYEPPGSNAAGFTGWSSRLATATASVSMSFLDQVKRRITPRSSSGRLAAAATASARARFSSPPSTIE